jgi:hypothetical protein
LVPIRRRFYFALTAYIVLAVSAWYTLEGNLRWMIAILMAALAVKSWIAVRRSELN